MMSWIIFIVIGGLIGWVGSLLMHTNAQMGILANVIVGIIGAALGRWVAGLMGVGGTGIGAYLIAVLGAVLLIFLLKVLGVFK
jgi:uncharacterized membrane protein YeaQ/YmgE (transglycosylase-associated protein family)